MKLLPINSIYRAHEGEGFHLGKPQVFIRLQGCSIGCINCDSKDTWDFGLGVKQEICDILYLVEKYRENDGINRVSITGGDPTHPIFEEGLTELIGELKKKNFFVNIEASGTRLPALLFDLVDYISFDVKTPSTGVSLKENIIKQFIEQYGLKGQVKSVIENREDFEFVLALKKAIAPTFENWILTPCYKTDEEFPQKRFQDILEWNYGAKSSFRIVGQQHKWFYSAKEKQV